jgi:hypothetical protein
LLKHSVKAEDDMITKRAVALIGFVASVGALLACSSDAANDSMQNAMNTSALGGDAGDAGRE